MKILHTSDWHLGRILHGQSLIEDQRAMLRQVLSVLGDDFDALLVAGDIYDRALPPVEATELLGEFLSDVAALGITTVIIPGNHDSAGRLNFASRLLAEQNVHLRCDYSRLAEPIRLTGRDGAEIDVFCLPFVEFAQLKEALGDDNLADTASAVEAAVARMGDSRSNGTPAVLMAHEFVGEGSIESDSERLFIGGARVLPAELFESFDYVALGHLHRPQKVAEQQSLRYSGSPLPYSFSEAVHIKSAVALEFHSGQTAPTIQKIPLELPRRMSVLEDTFEKLIEDPDYDAFVDHYVSARLTDAGYHLNLFAKLKDRFPHLLEVRQLRLEEDRSRSAEESLAHKADSPAELFEHFLEMFGWEDDDKERAQTLFQKAGEAVRRGEREA